MTDYSFKGISFKPLVPGPTPKPWHLYLDDSGEYYVIEHESDDVDPGDIAHVYVPGSNDPEARQDGEALATANLIAAAPDLQEAVRDMLAYYGHIPDYGHVCEICMTWVKALEKSKP